MWRVLPLVFVFMLSGCIGYIQETQEKNEKIAETNLRLGVGYAQQGKFEDALEKLIRAKQAKPEDGDVRSALALVYERLHEYDEADEEYREAIYLKPNDGGVYNNYGVFLCHRGDYEDADGYFLQAIAIRRYKTPERAYENAGSCAKKIPNLQKAEEYLRKALSIDPKRPLALYEMADIMYQNGQYLSSRGYLQRYEAVSQHSSQSAWLGINVERKLGDEVAEAHYAKVLQSKFPDSLEFKQWLNHEP